MDKKRNILKWIILTIAIAINIFIIVNAFLNGETSSKESSSVAQATADVINVIKPETITEANFPKFSYDIRKLFGHFGLFLLSGIFTTWSYYLFTKERKIGYFLFTISFSLIFGFALASFSELAQLFTRDRFGTWTDVGIDMSGYFIGVLLVILMLLILKKSIFKLKNYKKNQAK